ncbi:serine threonine kinase [Fusarium beomiforme]|uniref:Serine threonine kinase n=1 Tax=Fusarium beomiforme TaxID=44412 RepID=A0A9P5AIR8_9HYPO|nr:serine threonine kinase [Fusarium beomiforme]
MADSSLLREFLSMSKPAGDVATASYFPATALHTYWAAKKVEDLVRAKIELKYTQEDTVKKQYILSRKVGDHDTVAGYPVQSHYTTNDGHETPARPSKGLSNYLRTFSILAMIGNSHRTLFSEIMEETKEAYEIRRGLDGHWGYDTNILRQPIETFDISASDPPFYDCGNSFRPSFDKVEHLKSGGTGQVFRFSIHPSHVTDYGGEGKTEVSFAVKIICNGKAQDYAREVDAYRRLRLAEDPHPHIVPLLASFRWNNNYHLVFPLADGDLAMFWRNQPKPTHNKRTLEWFGSQMRGLVDGLTVLHGGHQGSQEPEPHRYGVHGDLKPENILWFNDDTKYAAFALTDFGSSYFLSPEKRDVPKGLKHTPVYRAPEVDTTSEGITQAYDIWSLGCVFAEAVTWLLDGYSGIMELTKARLDKMNNSPNRDAFFCLRLDKKGGLIASVKSKVQNRLTLLRRNSRFSPFIDDMLSLILDGMLKIDMQQRMTSWEVLNVLTEMCKKLESDPAYSQPRDDHDVEMAFSYNAPYFSTRSNSLTTSRFQVYTNQNASQQRLDRTVDANYYTNTTTQSFNDAASRIDLKPRFACPFFKAGMRVSIHSRACEGPGFLGVNKVKEHIFRCHLPKKYKGKHVCLRCDTGFETEDELQTHQDQDLRCPKRKPEPIYGMLTREQASRIRSLKRKSTKVSDEDRWFDIYRIIFPNFNRKQDDISPYHESNTASLSTLNSMSSNGISQYKSYLQKRDVEEYAAKLAKMGIPVTLEKASKLLELQVKDLETFDETMREPVRAYGIPADVSHEKANTEDVVPTGLGGSSDLLGEMQLQARYEDKEH